MRRPPPGPCSASLRRPRYPRLVPPHRRPLPRARPCCPPTHPSRTTRPHSNRPTSASAQSRSQPFHPCCSCSSRCPPPIADAKQRHARSPPGRTSAPLQVADVTQLRSRPAAARGAPPHHSRSAPPCAPASQLPLTPAQAPCASPPRLCHLPSRPRRQPPLPS